MTSLLLLVLRILAFAFKILTFGFGLLIPLMFGALIKFNRDVNFMHQLEMYTLQHDIQLTWDFWIVFWGVMLLLFIIPVLLLMLCAYLSEKLTQISLDIQTKKLVSDLNNGISRKFFLYLRPFKSTGNVDFEDEQQLPLTFVNATKSMFGTDLEFGLRRALRLFGPLIGLGKPGEHIGIGRYKTTESNWQDVARMLMDRSKGIFIIPANQPGTLWEIDTVVNDQGLLHKTVWIYPPSKTDIIGNDWAIVQGLLGESDIKFPDRPENCCAFTLTSDDDALSVDKKVDFDRTQSTHKLQEAAGFIYRPARLLSGTKAVVKTALSLVVILIVLRLCS